MNNQSKDKLQMWSHSNGAYTRVPAGIIEDKLKPAIYMLNYNDMGGFYFLTNVLDFTVPSELYGTIKADVDRIFATYNSREASSGIMLSGVMGSGKTLMAKLISHKALEYGMPTIIIQRAYSDPGFMEFIQNISQECVILFEEIDKVYDDIDKQNKILSLFDGIYTSKKLFILTANATYKISSFIVNRPGRCFYHLKFKGLDMAFIEDYCNRNLNDKTQIKSVLIVSKIVHEFNFDQLQALVQEMNRYNESAMASLKWLNIEATNNRRSWDTSLYINDTLIGDSHHDMLDDVLYGVDLREDYQTYPYEWSDSQREIGMYHSGDLSDFTPDEQKFASEFLSTYKLPKDFKFIFTMDSMVECDILQSKFVFEIDYQGKKVKVVYTETKKPEGVGASNRFNRLLA